MNEHIGSNFDDFLAEDGMLEDVEAAAIKKVVACLIRQSMDDAKITKVEMARRMDTSRGQLDRLLDPDNPSATLATIAKAAKAVGKRISISFDDIDNTAAA